MLHSQQAAMASLTDDLEKTTAVIGTIIEKLSAPKSETTAYDAAGVVRSETNEVGTAEDLRYKLTLFRRQYIYALYKRDVALLEGAATDFDEWAADYEAFRSSASEDWLKDLTASNDGGYTLQLPEEDRFLRSRSDLLNRISILLSGRVAH